MLRTLILLRHGEAERAAQSRKDFDRALTQAGAQAAQAAGAALKAAGFAPDLALVSTARRAQDTWAQVAPAFPGAALRSERGLYDASATSLYETALAAGAESVIVVAHNPGLAEAVAGLGGGAELGARGFPPASAAVFSREGEDQPWRLGAFIASGAAG